MDNFCTYGYNLDFDDSIDVFVRAVDSYQYGYGYGYAVGVDGPDYFDIFGIPGDNLGYFISDSWRWPMLENIFDYGYGYEHKDSLKLGETLSMQAMVVDGSIGTFTDDSFDLALEDDNYPMLVNDGRVAIIAVKNKNEIYSFDTRISGALNPDALISRLQYFPSAINYVERTLLSTDERTLVLAVVTVTGNRLYVFDIDAGGIVSTRGVVDINIQYNDARKMEVNHDGRWLYLEMNKNDGTPIIACVDIISSFNIVSEALSFSAPYNIGGVSSISNDGKRLVLKNENNGLIFLYVLDDHGNINKNAEIESVDYEITASNCKILKTTNNKYQLVFIAVNNYPTPFVFTVDLEVDYGHAVLTPLGSYDLAEGDNQNALITIGKEDGSVLIVVSNLDNGISNKVHFLNIDNDSSYGTITAYGVFNIDDSNEIVSNVVIYDEEGTIAGLHHDGAGTVTAFVAPITTGTYTATYLTKTYTNGTFTGTPRMAYKNRRMIIASNVNEVKSIRTNPAPYDNARGISIDLLTEGDAYTDIITGVTTDGRLDFSLCAPFETSDDPYNDRFIQVLAEAQNSTKHSDKLITTYSTTSVGYGYGYENFARQLIGTENFNVNSMYLAGNPAMQLGGGMHLISSDFDDANVTPDQFLIDSTMSPTGATYIVVTSNSEWQHPGQKTIEIIKKTGDVGFTKIGNFGNALGGDAIQSIACGFAGSRFYIAVACLTKMYITSTITPDNVTGYTSFDSTLSIFSEYTRASILNSPNNNADEAMLFHLLDANQRYIILNENGTIGTPVTIDDRGIVMRVLSGVNGANNVTYLVDFDDFDAFSTIGIRTLTSGVVGTSVVIDTITGAGLTGTEKNVKAHWDSNNNRLWVVASYTFTVASETTCRAKAYYSDDNGVTWSTGQEFDVDSDQNPSNRLASGSAILKDGTIIMATRRQEKSSTTYNSAGIAVIRYDEAPVEYNSDSYSVLNNTAIGREAMNMFVDNNGTAWILTQIYNPTTGTGSNNAVIAASPLTSFL